MCEAPRETPPLLTSKEPQTKDEQIQSGRHGDSATLIQDLPTSSLFRKKGKKEDLKSKQVNILFLCVCVKKSENRMLIFNS